MSTTPKTPTPAAMRAYLQRLGLTAEQAARRAYLSGGQVVRKYTGGAKPHRVSGAVWFALHAHEILDPETIARIERAMDRDAQEPAAPRRPVASEA